MKPRIILPEITADWLLARVRDDGAGCLVWTGYSRNGNPLTNLGASTGNGAVMVRRLVWKATTGREPHPNRIYRCSCGTLNCVEPAHVVELRAGARNEGKKRTVLQRAANAAAKRARSRLDMEAVRAIRAAGELQQVLADRYGISQDLVSSIQLGKAWRDYSSPFLQLEAR